MDRKPDPGKIALPASEFAKVFAEAGVLSDELASAKGASGKAKKIGRYLAPCVGREVAISVDGRTGKATLRTHAGRANKKLYYFDVAWDEAGGDMASVSQAPPVPELTDGLSEMPTDHIDQTHGEGRPTEVSTDGGNNEDW